jgi:hypothetical protein
LQLGSSVFSFYAACASESGRLVDAGDAEKRRLGFKTSSLHIALLKQYTGTKAESQSSLFSTDAAHASELEQCLVFAGDWAS